jgi:hypothetical protein
MEKKLRKSGLNIDKYQRGTQTKFKQKTKEAQTDDVKVVEEITETNSTNIQSQYAFNFGGQQVASNQDSIRVLESLPQLNQPPRQSRVMSAAQPSLANRLNQGIKNKFMLQLSESQNKNNDSSHTIQPQTSDVVSPRTIMSAVNRYRPSVAVNPIVEEEVTTPKLDIQSKEAIVSNY